MCRGECFSQGLTRLSWRQVPPVNSKRLGEQLLVLHWSKGSPDLNAAKKVADYLGTIHHSLLTIQEGIDAIREVIYHLETYDTTTVRAATPMYLMSRKIKAMGIKMVLSGGGQMRSSEGTCTSTRPQMPRRCKQSFATSLLICIFAVCAPISQPQHGVLRRELLFSMLIFLMRQ